MINKNDLKWLKDDIKQNKLPSLYFIHHGIAEDNMKGNWWFEKSPSDALLYNRDEIKNILKEDKNILAVFCGHQHWTKAIIEDGIKYFICGSLTENINNDGRPDGVWLEIDLLGNEVTVKCNHVKLDD